MPATQISFRTFLYFQLTFSNLKKSMKNSHVWREQKIIPVTLVGFELLGKPYQNLTE